MARINWEVRTDGWTWAVIPANTKALAIATAEAQYLRMQAQVEENLSSLCMRVERKPVPEFTAVKMGRVRPRAAMPIIDRMTGLPVIALDIIDTLPRMGEHHAKNA